MRTTVDRRGRLVLPKAIREAAGLAAGGELDVGLVDGVIELEPVMAPIRFERRGRFLVAVPAEGAREPLTEAIVEATRRSLRR